MGDEELDLTSLHLRRARRGEEASLSWVIAHFTPFLRLQAQYRIQGGMRRFLDSDDLVDEVWMIVLPRIADLDPRDGHCTPVLMKYLATTLLNRANNYLTRYIRSGTQSMPSVSASHGEGGPASQRLAAGETSVIGRVARNEARELLEATLQHLEPDERELLVLRGIEQHLNQEVAQWLGVDPSTVTKRYQRILEKLRARLPSSIYDELPS